MQKDLYVDILENNSKAIFQKEALLEVASAFAFDAITKILIAKTDIHSQSMYADKKLRQAALFAPNRAFLKKVIYQNNAIYPIENVKLLPSVSVTESLISEVSVLDSISRLQLPTFSLDVELKNEENLDTYNIVSPEILPAENLKMEVLESENNDKDRFASKYYVHVPVFGHTPKLCKEDLIKEFLSYRGVLDTEQVSTEMQQQIIQKFLDEEPVINRLSHNMADSNKSDLSKISTIQSDFITENYANILIKQKKIDKAIEIYTKLILKYPEKESYFAEKIILTQSYQS